MHRCLELARLGAGHTAPNPMVGAVLVHGSRIIGEGWHRQYGHAHAEVNCIASVSEEDLPLIPQSTLYVSLEPCAHFGKTPPCADLIIRKKIPHVVIGCRDPFAEVDGRGIERLKKAGVKTELGILEKECIHLNRRFFTFNTQNRPYILLKWAQSSDGRLAGAAGSRTKISNEYTDRLVHRWRTEEAGILVGAGTALADDPALTARLWEGPDPVRLVIDMNGRLPRSLRVFDGQTKTIVFNTAKHGEESKNLFFYHLSPETSLLPQILRALYEEKILSVLVEGGAATLQSFIDEGYWDEARVITNQDLHLGAGLAAPSLTGHQLISRENILPDTISCYKNTASAFGG